MALGAFAIGLTEFAIMGLLPQVATDLAVSVPTAGNLVTAYAVGVVVVGAPLLTAVGARRSRRTLLLAFMGLFAVGNGPKPVLWISAAAERGGDPQVE